MKFLKILLPFSLIFLLGCNYEKFDFLKFQTDLKKYEKISYILKAYSKQNKFLTKKDVFIKTRVYILDKNIELILPENNNLPTEIIDSRNNVNFNFDKKNNLQTVAIKNDGIYDLKKAIIKNPIQFIITISNDKTLIYNYKSNELYSIDKSMY